MSKVESPRFRRYSSETRGAMLVEAGIACLARGGITAFTVDNICREAGASRGLITHHFGSKDALLAAVYATMYDRFTEVAAPAGADEPGLAELVAASFAPEVFNPESLKVWLALWGEIANNPDLRAVHRRRYRELLARTADTLRRASQARGCAVDAERIAVQFIALTDGLWLEHAIDTTMLSRGAAQASCLAFLEKALGAPA